jgi:hypothetical protein
LELRFLFQKKIEIELSLVRSSGYLIKEKKVLIGYLLRWLKVSIFIVTNHYRELKRRIYQGPNGERSRPGIWESNRPWWVLASLPKASLADVWLGCGNLRKCVDSISPTPEN